MQQPTQLSRMQRRRARELAQALRPPRVFLRVLGTLPLLALGLILLVHSTLAWLTDRDTLPRSFAATSGTFSTLMDLSETELHLSGPKGDPYETSFTVTSKAQVPLPIRAEWDGAGRRPDVNLSADTIGAAGSPGDSIKVTISGDYADFSGTLWIYIGSNNYDRGPVAVNVNAISHDIEEYISVKSFEIPCSGTAGSQIKKAVAMTVTWLTPEGDRPPISISVEQSPPDTDPVRIYDGPDKQGGKPITSIDPSVDSVDLYLNPGRVSHGNPITVTVTLSSPSERVRGSISRTFTLQQCGDANSGDEECKFGDECKQGHGDGHCPDGGPDQDDGHGQGDDPGQGGCGQDHLDGDPSVGHHGQGADGAPVSDGSQQGDGTQEQDAEGHDAGNAVDGTSGGGSGDGAAGDEAQGGTGTDGGDAADEAAGDEPEDAVGGDTSSSVETPAEGSGEGAAGDEAQNGATADSGDAAGDAAGEHPEGVTGGDTGTSGAVVEGGSDGEVVGDESEGGTGTDDGDVSDGTAADGDSTGDDVSAGAATDVPVKSWGVIPQ